MFVSLSIYISQKLKYMDILLVILGVICLLVGLAGVFFADLAGAAGSVFGFVAVAFYGLCGIYGYGVGRVGIAGRVGTGDGLCYAHAGD